MKRFSALVTVFLLPFCSAQAGEFKVAGMTFAGPKEFASVKPTSFMRKAQLKVGVEKGVEVVGGGQSLLDGGLAAALSDVADGGDFVEPGFAHGSEVVVGGHAAEADNAGFDGGHAVLLH